MTESNIPEMQTAYVLDLISREDFVSIERDAFDYVRERLHGRIAILQADLPESLLARIFQRNKREANLEQLEDARRGRRLATETIIALKSSQPSYNQFRQTIEAHKELTLTSQQAHDYYIDYQEQLRNLNAL